MSALFDRVHYPMLEVQPIKPQIVIVTQDRDDVSYVYQSQHSRRSRKRRRVSWSVVEAADLAGVSENAVRSSWKRGIVIPSFEWPEREFLTPRYSSPDVFALRVVADLADAGSPRRIQQLVASDLYEAFGNYGKKVGFGLAEILSTGPRLFLPANVITAEMLYKKIRGVLVMGGDDEDEAYYGDVFAEHPKMKLLEYPVEQRVAELRMRIDAWWTRKGDPGPPARKDENRPAWESEGRPPWMT